MLLFLLVRTLSFVRAWCWGHPLIMALALICNFISTSIVLWNWVHKLFCLCMFRIVIASWLIAPLINIKWPLSLQSSFGLKSTLSGIRIMIPSYFPSPFTWNIFFHLFIVRQQLYNNEMYFLEVVYKIILFLIQSVSQCFCCWYCCCCCCLEIRGYCVALETCYVHPWVFDLRIEVIHMASELLLKYIYIILVDFVVFGVFL